MARCSTPVQIYSHPRQNKLGCQIIDEAIISVRFLISNLCQKWVAFSKKKMFHLWRVPNWPHSIKLSRSNFFVLLRTLNNTKFQGDKWLNIKKKYLKRLVCLIKYNWWHCTDDCCACVTSQRVLKDASQFGISIWNMPGNLIRNTITSSFFIPNSHQEIIHFPKPK